MIKIITSFIINAQKTYPTKDNESLRELIMKQLSEFDIRQVNGLIEEINDEQQVFGCYNVKGEFVQKEPKDSSVTFITQDQPLYAAIQQMEQGSVIITDVDGKLVLGQMQTKYSARLLIESNYLQILMSKIHHFLNFISMDTVQTLPPYVPYSDEKHNVLRMLQYDYAAVLNDEGRIVSAKHL